MRSYYPHIVYVGDEKSKRAVKVNTALEHENRFPEDFAEFQKEIAAESLTSESLTEAAKIERERCAQIAEGMERGNKMGIKIAAAIRKSPEPEDEVASGPPVPPTVEQVMSKGYSKEAAEKIVGEELRKFNTGEKPYGTKEPTTPVVPPAPATPTPAAAVPVAESK